MLATPEQFHDAVRAFEEAAQLNPQTPGRTGCLVQLTPELADEVLITGDLHGNRENYDRILALADLAHHPRRHLLLQEVCHGGPSYPQSNGCMSHTLLEDVARLKLRFPAQVHFLLGNHELAELVDFPIRKNQQTLNVTFRLGLEQCYGASFGAVREAYRAFLRTCPLAVRLQSGVFISHSLPENVDRYGFDVAVFSKPCSFSASFEDDPVFDLLWGRDYRRANARAFAELVGATVIVNGHEPCPAGAQVPNDVQVILDCCGRNACCLLLPVDRPLAHCEVVARIRPLA